jgi:hypothetical protein
MSEHVEYLLREMCRRVGADYDTMDFKKQDWYMDYSWTEAEETEYRAWMLDVLKHNKMVRKGFGITITSSAYLKKEIMWWMLMYGWKNENNNNV